MLKLSGTLHNIFLTPSSVIARTGEIRPDQWRVQLLVDEPQKSGGHRTQMHTLKIESEFAPLFQKHIGKILTCPIGVFVDRTAGSLIFFIPKGVSSKDFSVSEPQKAAA